jgi:outer membrane protein assembly factor BamB
MPRVTIARTAVPATGLNITDATYTTLGVGAANGVEIPYRDGDLLILRNDSGSSATYTLKVAQPAVYSDVGVTVPDVTIVVATGKMHVVNTDAIMRQADGDVYIDCSVAGKVLCLGLG